MNILQEITPNYAPPSGFTFAGGHCGIKKTRPDLALIISSVPAVAAGCFTQNPIRAACVDRNAGLLPSSKISAVIVNSGNANAMTGEAGVRANLAMAEHAAAALDTDPSQVLSVSTGVIGVALNTKVIGKKTPALVAEAGPSPVPFAGAILTTDTGTKVAHTELVLGESTKPIKILGLAKGSGMIHPNMATTLGFICTDAAISAEALQQILSEHIVTTFNAITVDGDTSTNDSVVVLANGESKQFIESPEDLSLFAQALHGVLQALAKQVAQDGEGATRLLEVQVNGAATQADAQALARGICRSSLLKCSVFAAQGEWGRLAAAAGQAAFESGVSLGPTDLSISVQGIALVKAGAAVPVENKTELARKLREPNVRWQVDLPTGSAHFTAWGCDLSYDYVRINADEATQVEVTPGGMVARNLTLAAYSPRLKHQLLVDGLTYVRRFAGIRALIYVRGAVAQRFDLTASLVQDLELCADAGLKALVVVPNAQIGDTILEHMNNTGHFAAPVTGDPMQIGALLDRGHLCVLTEAAPEPGEQIDLAVKLGIQKFLALGDSQGLEDHAGLVSVLSPQLLLAGLDRNRFETNNPEFFAIARQGAVRGVPAVHLIDGRIPHALVGELFTDQGIGTLITGQTI